MDDTILVDAAPVTDEDYAKAIDEILAEMRRMKAEMDERQQRIEHLRAETEALLAELPTSPLR